MGVSRYELVKTILSNCVAPERVFIRDNQSYCAILLDDNNRKPICRLHFSSSNKRLIVMRSERDDRGRQETNQYPIETVNDILNHTDELKEVVVRYLDESS